MILTNEVVSCKAGCVRLVLVMHHHGSCPDPRPGASHSASLYCCIAAKE